MLRPRAALSSLTAPLRHPSLSRPLSSARDASPVAALQRRYPPPRAAPRMTRSHHTITTFSRPASATPLQLSTRVHVGRGPPLLNAAVYARVFHSTPRRSDVFFVAAPGIKAALLAITRTTLLFLPFVFRYKLWKKYRRTSLLLIQIPIFAICLVLALGLDQSPWTGRWRLLLMSEGEEQAWSFRKHKDILLHDGPLILPPEDARSTQVARVTKRLVCALEEEEGSMVYGASWPPNGHGLAMKERDQQTRLERYQPSATAAATDALPFRPETQNPLKRSRFDEADWNIYVIETPKLVNAFALPSKEIFLYTGLLDMLPDNDDPMLAAVLAHEMAHVVQRHGVENLGFMNLAAVAFDVLRGFTFALTISFPFVTDSAGMAINWLNDVVAERAYSRKLEEEADLVGLHLMAVAGYDPRAMLDLWELMACLEADVAAQGGGKHELAMLRTHPSSEERQEAIAKALPKAMAAFRKSRQPTLAAIEVKAQQREAERKELEKKQEPVAKDSEIAAQPVRI